MGATPQDKQNSARQTTPISKAFVKRLTFSESAILYFPKAYTSMYLGIFQADKNLLLL